MFRPGGRLEEGGRESKGHHEPGVRLPGGTRPDAEDLCPKQHILTAL